MQKLNFAEGGKLVHVYKQKRFPFSLSKARRAERVGLATHTGR